MKADFPTYNFLTTSDDMFTPTEDLLLSPGPVWHGSAIGWPTDIDKYITKHEINNPRFCGVKHEDIENNFSILAYSVYLPTAGRDEEFLEVLSALTADLEQHLTPHSTIIIGCDSNQSEKSSKRRTRAMNNFLEHFKLSPILTGEAPTFHHNKMKVK